jgi:hypothetical protein
MFYDIPAAAVQIIWTGREASQVDQQSWEK